MILAGTCDEFSSGQAKVDTHTDTHTHTQTQAMTIPVGQKGPRVITLLDLDNVDIVLQATFSKLCWIRTSVFGFNFREVYSQGSWVRIASGSGSMSSRNKPFHEPLTTLSTDIHILHWSRWVGSSTFSSFSKITAGTQPTIWLPQLPTHTPEEWDNTIKLTQWELKT